MKNLIRESLRSLSYKLEQLNNKIIYYLIIIIIINWYSIDSISESTYLLGSVPVSNKLKDVNKKFSRKLKEVKPLKITEINFDTKSRFYNFTLFNKYLLKDKRLLASIYKSLFMNTKFIKFGENKVLILFVILNNGEYYTLHPNILINNKTKFKDYWDKVKNDFKSFSDKPYIFEDFIYLNIKVWNMDLYKNKNIKITKNTIGIFPINWNRRSFHTSSLLNYKAVKPLTIKPLNINPSIPSKFTTLDIETIKFNDIQVPILITLHNNLIKKHFLVDKILFKNNPNLAINKLWKDLFDFFKDNAHIIDYQTIFIHNLGYFDGFFLYKYLSSFYPQSVKTLIDDLNRFIIIEWKIDKIKIKFLDSFRILPASLNELADKFDVKGKLHPYKNEFNTIDILNNDNLLQSFLDYAIQDSNTLFDVLIKAQLYYLDNLSVDITSILSLPSLSFKIFRSKFLNVNIPTLKSSQDTFIRKGYFGGATDYYKAYIKKGKQYDVNSLYPDSMLKQSMPFKIINVYSNMDNIILNDFFGFALAKLTCPKTMERPMLPYKSESKTIFPTGTWMGVYFSEELKAVAKLGYTIKLISGYEFSKIDLFSKYVDYFFNIKKVATGITRFIAKLHLNSLYGIFGRKLIISEIIIIRKEDLPIYLLNKVIINIIELNDDYIAIKISSNLNKSTLAELNSKLQTEFTNNFKSPVLSNVAIAAAITAYARIHMIPFKLMEGTAYSDTDCIFTDQPLPPHLIGDDLGLMKDELNGSFIEEAYFFGIKQYGFWYVDNKGNRIERSVFAGVERNSIPWNEIVDLFNGKTLNKVKENVFFKSMKNLNIKIKDRTLKLQFKSDKKLINNKYLPPHMFNPVLNKINKTNRLIKLIKQNWRLL